MEQSQPSPSISEPVPDIKPATAARTVPTLPQVPMKKILFAFLGVFVVLILIIAGKFFMDRSAKGSVTNAARPITLTYWGMMDNSDALKAVISQFQSDHPGVTIQYSQQSPKDYSERLISACSRSQCPDIFRYHSTWVSQYLQRGLLAPLPSTVMSSSEFENTFYPVASADLKTSSGYVGMPLMYDGLGLYINKRILQASGKSVPTTWDDLRALARDLTITAADGSIERSGAALGTSTNVDHFSDILATLIYQNGGDPLKPESFGSTSQGSSGNAPASLVGDALTFYSQFSRADKIWNDTMPNSTYAFAIERTAMIIAPAYRAAEIKKINPNFEFAVYPIPQLPGKPVTYANYWVEGVSKSSKEQEMAWTFLKYLSSKDTLQKLNPIGDGKIIREVYPRRDMSTLLVNDPYAGAVIQQALNAKSSYLASRTFDKGLNDELIALYSDIITQMASGKRYEDLAPQFAPSVQTVIQKYGLSTSVPILK